MSCGNTKSYDLGKVYQGSAPWIKPAYAAPEFSLNVSYAISPTRTMSYGGSSMHMYGPLPKPELHTPSEPLRYENNSQNKVENQMMSYELMSYKLMKDLKHDMSQLINKQQNLESKLRRVLLN
jgi:hypothetical protein